MAEAAQNCGGIWVTLLVLLVGSALTVGDASGAGGAAREWKNGAIVFSSQRRDGAWELYAIGPSGGATKQLTANSPLAYGKPIWSPDGRTIEFGTVYGTTVLVDARTGARRKLATGGTPLQWSPDGRRVVYGGDGIWIADSSGAHRHRLTSNRLDTGPAWSPDGTSILFTRASRIYWQDAKGGTPRLIAVGAAPVWSPDGRLIAYTRDQALGGKALFVVSVGGGTATKLGPIDGAAWSPASDELVILAAAKAGERPQLVLVSADGSSRRDLTVPGCHPYGGLVWAPGPAVTVRGFCQDRDAVRSGLLKVDAATGEWHWLRSVTTNVDAQIPSDPSWSTDGKRLAYLQAGVLMVVNADGSGAHEVLDPPAGEQTQPAWSPDGRSIAVTASRLNALPGAPRLVASPVASPSWSPDGTRLVGEPNYFDVAIANLKTGTQKVIYHDDGAGQISLFNGDWSHDGKRIAFGSDNGLVLYDVAHRRLLPLSAGGDDPDWSPDDTYLAGDNGECAFRVKDHTRPCSLWVSRADGSHLRRLAADAWDPEWSPDGHQIAFVRLVGSNNTEIYTMNTDGSGQRRLTHNPGPDVEPTWQPIH